MINTNILKLGDDTILPRGTFNLGNLIVRIHDSNPFSTYPPSEEEFLSCDPLHVISHEVSHVIQLLTTPCGAHLLLCQLHQSALYLGILRELASLNDGVIRMPILSWIQDLFSDVRSVPDQLHRSLEWWLELEHDTCYMMLPFAERSLPLVDSAKSEDYWTSAEIIQTNLLGKSVPVITVKYPGHQPEIWPVGVVLIMETMSMVMDAMRQTTADDFWGRVKDLGHPTLRRYGIPFLHYVFTVPQDRHNFLEFLAICELSLLYYPVSSSYQSEDILHFHPGGIFLRALKILASPENAVPRISTNDNRSPDGKAFVETMIQLLRLPTIPEALQIMIHSLRSVLAHGRTDTHKVELALEGLSLRAQLLANELFVFNMVDAKFAYLIFAKLAPLVRYDDLTCIADIFDKSDPYLFRSFLHSEEVGHQLFHKESLRCQYNLNGGCDLWCHIRACDSGDMLSYHYKCPFQMLVKELHQERMGIKEIRSLYA